MFGLIWGIPCLVIFVFLFDTIAPSFGYERITDTDIKFVLLGEIRNINYSFFLEIEKIDFESFEKKVYERLISEILRMRQVPVNYFGFYFWKEIDPELARQQVIKVNKKFEDEASFFKYLGELTNQYMEKGKPLCEFRLIEDYTEDTSMIIFRAQHSFGDAVGCASMFSALNDDQFSIPNKKSFPSYGVWQKLILLVSTIFRFGKVSKKMKQIKTDENTKKIFKKSTAKISQTRYAYSNTEIPFEAIKAYYKEYEGMTLNDFALAIFGKSFYQYCKQEGIEDCQLLKCAMPVSHKTLPTGYDNLCIKNYAIFTYLQLYLTDSIESGFKKMKPYLKYILSPDVQKQFINHEHIAPYCSKSSMLNDFLAGGKGNYFSLSNFILSDRPYVI